MKEAGFIDYTSPSGYVFRINQRKGTYLVYSPEGFLLEDGKHKGNTVVFSLVYVLFLGSEFDILQDVKNSVFFFDVVEGGVFIPFSVAGVSGRRFFNVPVWSDVDQVPMMVHHYRKYRLSFLRRGMSGSLFFIVGPSVKKEEIVRLKYKFPYSRVVVFDPGVEDFQSTVVAQSTDEVRATDLIEREMGHKDTSDPVFMTRLFLRELNWVKMNTIALVYRLNLDQIDMISSFLRKMLLKVDRFAELKKNESKIRELLGLFHFLSVVFRFDKKEFLKYLDSVDLKRSDLVRYRDVIYSQKNLCLDSSDEKRFFTFVLEQISVIS